MHAEIIGPQDDGKNPLPETQVQESDRKEPSRAPHSEDIRPKKTFPKHICDVLAIAVLRSKGSPSEFQPVRRGLGQVASPEFYRRESG